MQWMFPFPGNKCFQNKRETKFYLVIFANAVKDMTILSCNDFHNHMIAKQQELEKTMRELYKQKEE